MTQSKGNTRPKIIAAITTALLVGSFVFLTWELGKNSRLDEDLKREKLNTETLLSEKLLLEKKIVTFKSEVKSLEGKNGELDKILASTVQNLEAREKELKALRKQNISVAQLKTQNQDLQKLKEAVEQQLSSYKTSFAELQRSNEDMALTVESLREQNNLLTNELKAARLASINDVLVESVKRNDRLTVHARKTRRLAFSMDIPVSAENLKFRITGPEGKELKISEGDVTVKVLNDKSFSAQAFYVSSSSEKSMLQPYKRVEMLYTPKARLAPGTYKVEITGDSGSIGSLQVKLR